MADYADAGWLKNAELLWYDGLVKRFFRIARHILMGGSLLLCLMTMVLWGLGRSRAFWVAGYRAHWSGPVHVDRASVQIYSERGRLLMLAGRYDEGILGAPAKIVEESHLGALEGRYFYMGPRLMTPGIDATERARAQVDRLGVYVNGQWGPYRTRYSVATFSGKRAALAVGLPAWVVVLVTGVWPGARVWGWWRAKRRVASGLCRVCGYDLRATPERCPECGMVA
jgi:hypothetical protein